MMVKEPGWNLAQTFSLQLVCQEDVVVVAALVADVAVVEEVLLLVVEVDVVVALVVCAEAVAAAVKFLHNNM
jgi:hypothetical protein